MPLMKSSRKQSGRVRFPTTRGYRKKLGFKRRKLARTNVNKRRPGLNAKIFKAMRNYGETKLIPTINVSPTGSGNASGAPDVRVVGGSQQPGYYYAAILGGVLPVNWDANIKQLGGLSIEEGVKNNQRVGDYVWLKKTHLTIQLDMEPVLENRGPIQFRLIVVKQRMATVPTGLVYHPEASLFLKNDGDSFGYENGGNEFQIQNMPINKRNWVCFRDQRFTLSPPQSAIGDQFFTSMYPIRKNIVINLNHFKKTKYQDAEGANQNRPLNYDGRYLVYLFASPMGSTLSADNWHVNMSGTTSFTDV